jgi:hypothetical protein
MRRLNLRSLAREPFSGQQELRVESQIVVARARGVPASSPGSSYFSPEDDLLPKFVIEREIPAAGKLPPDQLKAISQKSCAILRELGPQIQWVESFVTDDKLYCVYIAPDEATVRQHAERGGFPANRISQVRSVIDPTTSE